MAENVDFRPTGKVKPGTGRQEIETGLRDLGPAFAGQERIKRLFQAMQVKHIRGGIGFLRFGQIGRPPIRCLLHLGDVGIEQLLQKVFKSVAVGERADQLGGDLGAIDRGGKRAKGMIHHRDVEAAKVKQLQHRRVGQKPRQVGRGLLARRDLHQMRIAITSRELNKAKPVAMRVQAHRFAIDRDDRPKVQPVGQIILMEMNGHDPIPLCRVCRDISPPALKCDRFRKLAQCCAGHDTAQMQFPISGSDDRHEVDWCPGDVAGS